MQGSHLNFNGNLKFACSTRKSISDLCRAIGVNRQQFNRYLNAGTLPSAHNRLRIAAAFGLEPADFDLAPHAFRARLLEGRHASPGRGPLDDAFPGDLRALRAYLGFYQTWHISLSWPGRIVCSCAHLREKDGQVQVTSLERIMDHENGVVQRSRYVGLAAYQRQRIFLTELTRGEAPTFGQTILMPFEIHQRRYLRGLTMGISWRNNNLPYATRTIWRHLGTSTDRRGLIAACGIYKPTSAILPSVVASFLTEPALIAAGTMQP
ncbi:helix-turn-helix domain-containing protein [Pseudaminobacter salicylatoxidans]|uniref:helix-turn-helix domain-containing protein n=1 Tax=Pseudaminobacter salicylatoxidans TaxID=93369 RepID=UPI0002E05945|nr:helix-turn-helix transcriptional regulator [Pseudaminobacter salicylatoxidans]